MLGAPQCYRDSQRLLHSGADHHCRRVRHCVDGRRQSSGRDTSYFHRHGESVETLLCKAHLLSVGLLIFSFDPALCLLFQPPICIKPWAEERKLVLCIDIQARQGDLSLQVNTRCEHGYCVSWPSGCGKNPLLRVIAGLTPSEVC